VTPIRSACGGADDPAGDGGVTAVHAASAGGETVAAVVVTRNRATHLIRCLESLQAQTHPVDAIIVVDNASTDHTRAVVAQGFPDAVYHRLGENTGSGGGYAEGLRLAHETGREWLWALDDEVVLEPDVLERMVVRATATPRADIILPAERDPRTGRSRVHPAWYGPFIHRGVVAKIGLPLAEFFWWAADTEFFLRARQQGGFRVVYAHDIVITHDKRDPAQREKKRHPSRLYYQTRNTIYVRRHINRSAYKLMRSLWRVVLGRVAVVVLTRERDKVRKCLMILRGAYDGLRGRLGKTVEIG
jgi:rhamnopyranosyl-N-acetylglucosaminyl-diphospho-decaprenol beta-1,3/1,4-galactofuranosyltransferase